MIRRHMLTQTTALITVVLLRWLTSLTLIEATLLVLLSEVVSFSTAMISEIDRPRRRP